LPTTYGAVGMDALHLLPFEPMGLPTQSESPLQSSTTSHIHLPSNLIQVEINSCFHLSHSGRHLKKPLIRTGFMACLAFEVYMSLSLNGRIETYVIHYL